MKICMSGMLMVSLFLASQGCTLDYGDALTDEDIAENIPNTVIEGFSYVSVRQGKPVIEINAEKAMTFNKKKETHLEKVEFREFSSNGEVTATGYGNFGIMYLDSEDVDMQGGIRLHSSVEKAGITADTLYWKKETKELRGSQDGTVRIEKDDGTYIEGQSFHGNLRKKVFIFGQNVKGEYVIESEDQDAGQITDEE